VAVPYLWVKMYNLAECQTYSNSRVHGIGRVTVWSQKLVFGFGMSSGVSCFPGEVCGCVPGLLRTGSPVVPQWFF
jgi:hypothetical protein